MIVASVHGRVGSDPVATRTKNDKEMYRASIVVNITGHGATDDKSIWISVLAFGNTSETLALARKGESLSAMGKLSRSHYVGKDGTHRESWSLLADAIVTTRSARPPGGRKAAARDPDRRDQVDFDGPINF